MIDRWSYRRINTLINQAESRAAQATKWQPFVGYWSDNASINNSCVTYLETRNMNVLIRMIHSIKYRNRILLFYFILSFLAKWCIVEPITM